MNKLDSVSAGVGVTSGVTSHQAETDFSRYLKLPFDEKLVYGYAPLLWIMALLLAVLLAGCGNGGSDSILGGGTASGVNKEITAYSLNGIAGTVNESAKTIAVTVPFATNVTALVATYTHNGVSVKVGATAQVSGTTPNDFSGPVLYTVAAQDNSTAIYTVTVTVAQSTAKAMTSFSFAGYAGATGVINEAAKTIAVTVPNATNVTALVATFASTGANVKVGATTQASGTTANDFSSPVAYTVTAANASTAVYTVTVTVAPSTAKAITAFSFAGFTGATGVINQPAKTIAVTVPNGTNVLALVATFTTTGSNVSVGGTTQTSALTANNFTGAVAYTVTAGDASTAIYTVTVTIAPSAAKAITGFSFAGYTGATGVINEAAKTIAVTVPNGTDVTALVATFSTTGTVVRVGAAVQTSTATANDFTSPVVYAVTAANATIASYTVNVAVAASTAKAMTGFSFAGYTGATGVINEAAKTIAVTVPNGTDVTSLVATFATTGANVKVGAAVQTSTATANDFTSPVAYIVTAANASTATYTVTVTVAASTAKAFTGYSFAGYTGATGVINEAAKTIAVTVPNGTDVTSLAATFATTGANVKVGAAVQTSTATANDFTSPVAYIVTAANASTATYTVTVNVAASTAKAMTGFSFAGYTGATGVINEAAKTIAVTVPNGTDVTSLVATFASTGVNVKVGAAIQTSTATANDFTSPVAYIVTAANASTATYTVTVNVAASTAKAMTAFSFAGYTGATGVINEAAKTIAVTVPNGTDVTTLAATFSSTGVNVKVGAAIQTSTATANDFTSPVAYIVTAANATTATYTVTVTVAASTAKAMTGFSFAGYTGATGVINEAAKTIAVTVPNGTDVTTLVATFATTGANVKVGVAVQTSAATANDFTSPVAYIVTAANASTATYTVTVAVAASTAKAMTGFSFAGYTGATGVINEAAKTIAVTVPNGTDVTSLMATFASTGVSVKVGVAVQTSTATANDFTSPVAYTVTAGDASTATYMVTVNVAASTAKAITAYSFAGYTGATGVINEAAKTIAVTVPNGTDVTTLVATFATTGVNVKVGAAVQTSAATANNFTTPVIYQVTAANASTVNYTVTVTVAASTAKAITAYSFAGYTGATGSINELAKTIAVTVPNGTDVTTLAATFTTTGVSVKVGAAVQTSTATANDFTSPVAYTVTAGDASTTTYTVTVSIAPSTAKALTAFSFAGYSGATGVINELAKTVAVTVPNGTDVTALVATFASTGANVKVGLTTQTSTVTPNDFTAPVAYIVTAADASTATYTVTVSLPLGPAPVFLGTAGNFVILAKSGISTVPDSAVTGNMGLSPAAASFITGFTLIADASNVFSTSTQVVGQVFAADYTAPTPSNMTTAISDMETAYTDAAGRAIPDFTELGAGDISGLTLVPGLYKWGTGVLVTVTGVTISGGENDVWIFQIAGDLTVDNSAIITLAGGAQAKNIFWQVAGQATLGTAADFKGILLSQTLISLATGATVNGRLLAQTAVTLQQSTVTEPTP